MTVNIREIAEQMVRHIEANLDSAFLDYLMDSKPTLRRAATYRQPRQEGQHVYYWTALHAAARHGRLDMIEQFAKAGVTVETQDEYKRTPLWYAAAYAHSETLAKLISMGAKIKYSDNNGWTPLHAAARNGHMTLVRDLLNNESVNSSNNGISPRLHLVNQADKTGFTALHKAVWGGHLGVVDLLLRCSHTEVNHGSQEDRMTPLHLAVDRGNSQMVDLLLRHSADVNARTGNGLTPLMLGSQRAEDRLVRMLLQRGADPTLVTDNGWTALHMAAGTKSSACLQLLIRRPNIEINRPNHSGWTPFHLAARHSRCESLEFLVEADADIIALTEQGNTALHLAAMDDDPSGMRYLLSLSEPPFIDKENCDGQSALHIASARGSVPIGELLIKAGANVGLRDAKDCSCLHLAAQNRHIEMVKLLLIGGANPFHSLSLFKLGWYGLKLNSFRGKLLTTSRLAITHGEHSHE